MAYSMLGLFTFEQLNDEEFKITFELPDNCFFDFTEADDEYTLAIKLNPEETDPSATFVTDVVTAEILNKTQVTNFEQHERELVIRKPKVRFEF